MLVLLCSFQSRLLAHNGQGASVHKLRSTQSRGDLVLQGSLHSAQWAQCLLAIQACPGRPEAPQASCHKEAELTATQHKWCPMGCNLFASNVALVQSWHACSL